jgi:hypothetical protein
MRPEIKADFRPAGDVPEMLAQKFVTDRIRHLLRDACSTNVKVLLLRSHRMRAGLHRHSDLDRRLRGLPPKSGSATSEIQRRQRQNREDARAQGKIDHPRNALLMLQFAERLRHGTLVRSANGPSQILSENAHARGKPHRHEQLSAKNNDHDRLHAPNMALNRSEREEKAV